MVFRDRSDAGRRLGSRLAAWRGRDVVVLGLPRGGVPVAAEVARALGAPLDVIVVRKLGLPFQPEVAMGAVGEGGVLALNENVLRSGGVGSSELAAVEARERAEVDRRTALFRGGTPRVPLSGRAVIVVDDGVATGATARAACQVARAQGAAPVVLAIPVAPPDTVHSLAADADEVVCLETPTRFRAVGEWYQDFSQTGDDEVVRLLQAARPPVGSSGAERDVQIHAGRARLHGHLTVPPDPKGLVVFAHGSGSSRHSPRNRAVAAALNEQGLATLLLDLLTPAEEGDRSNVFDVGLLAERLLAARRWARDDEACADLPVGCFGASTGAAAALWAAADASADIAAVVSRGGRPDLAAERLPLVTAPTLLIVGGDDRTVLDLNRQAQALLPGETGLAVVPGATHLFEEPGALEAVARLAGDWFCRHLAVSRRRVREPQG